MVNTQNIKQAIGIQVTFITEKNLQREQFSAKEPSLFEDLCIRFKPFGNLYTMPQVKE